VHSVRLVSRAKIILGLDRSGGRTPEKQGGLAKRLGASRHTVIKARDAFLVLKSAPLFLRRKKREAACATEGNRRTGSQDGGAGLRQAPGGLRPLDAASSGGEMR